MDGLSYLLRYVRSHFMWKRVNMVHQRGAPMAVSWRNNDYE
jgi:hypothetical protein